MAGAIPKRSPEKARLRGAGGQALVFPRLRALRWLPPILLALATVLALGVAYSARPVVSVDVGDYFDTPFLPNTQERPVAEADFHAREVSPSAPPQSIAWPAGQAVLELPGRREGLWQVAVQVDLAQPGASLEDVTLSINDVRLWIPRGDSRELVAVVPPELASVDTWRLRIEPSVVGERIPEAARPGSITLTPARTYRWTSGQSTISLPGLGRGDWTVALLASIQHPDGQPLDAVVAANGVPVARLPEGGVRRVAFLVPASLLPDGDLTLSISSKTFKDPRELGIALYEIGVAPAGPPAALPPPKYLLYALAIALSLYVCLLRMTRRAALAATAGLLVVLAGAWALGAARYPAAFMLPRLAALAIWSVALLLALERLAAWVFRRAGVPLSDGLLRALLLVFFVGYWIKAGGMLYPYFVGIDMRLQMSWARRIFSGEFWTFYGTSNPMNERTMPTAMWGENKPVIPYSPWFHIFAGIFLLAPMPMALAGHMFSALVDVSRVFLIGLLARKVGCSERESLFASLLYAVTPVTFLLHSWGNLPTTFSLWWMLVCTVFIVVAYRWLDRPWPFIALTLLLTATMLVYTFMAMLMVAFLGLLVLALWIARWTTGDRRPTTDDQGLSPRPVSGVGLSSFVVGRPREGRSIAAIVLATAAAIALATLVYYGQYIPLIVQKTIPYFLGGTGGQRAGIQDHQPFLEYLAGYLPRLGYSTRPGSFGLILPLLLAAMGILLVRSRRVLALFLCSAAVTALFVLVGSRVDMVDKHVFYLVPVLCLLAGALLSRLWARGLLARLVVTSIYLFTLAVALDLWLYRIVSVRQ